MFILKLVKKSLSRPRDTANTFTPLVWLLWAIRVCVFFLSFYQIIFNERGFGAVSLLCFFAITTPKYFTRGKITRFPVELELLLFFIVILQYIIGEIADFYATVKYFDKFVHFTIPFLISIINYIVFYTMYAIGKLKTSVLNIFLMVVFFTLGIGALWEIIEYCFDLFIKPLGFSHALQGSLTESPFYDTMNDLVADFVGGVLGALYSVVFLLKNRKVGRSKEIIKEIETQFFKGN